VIDRDGFFAHHQAESATEEHSRQRDEEGLELEKVDETSHGTAQKQPAQQHGENDREGREVMLFDKAGREDADAPDHGANGEVDAAGEDHEGHAHRSNPEKRIIGEQIDQDQRAGEAAIEEAAGEVQDEANRRGGEKRQVTLGDSQRGDVQGSARILERRR